MLDAAEALLRDDAQHRDELLVRLGQKPKHVEAIEEFLAEPVEVEEVETNLTELASFTAQVNAMFGGAEQAGA